MKRFLFILLASGLTIGIHPSEAQDLTYFFTRFEMDEGYAPGPLDRQDTEFQLLQGAAEIARGEPQAAGQWLETRPGDPCTAIFLTGDRIAGNGFTYLEFWARPIATDEERGEEFLDFNGAVLGFFLDGDAGTLFAYHPVSDSEGFWISTGVTVPVDSSGIAETWIRINIAADLLRRTWEVSVDNRPALTGINHAGAPRSGDTFELWLYGHETGPNRFDDILISSLPPDALENVLKSRLPRQTVSAGKTSATAKQAGRPEPAQQRRNNHLPAPDPGRRADLLVIDADIEIIAGAHQAGKAKDVEVEGQKMDLVFYSLQYDADGNPLPLTVRVTCNAVLTEGSDLSQIEWVLTEVWKRDEARKVIARGNFEKGLTLEITIPGESAKKGSTATIGTGLQSSIKATADGEVLLP